MDKIGLYQQWVKWIMMCVDR